MVHRLGRLLTAALAQWRGTAALFLLPFLVHLPALWADPDPIFYAGEVTAAGRMVWAGLPGSLDLNAGWTTQTQGAIAARQWLAGEVPWWNPYAGLGLPLAAAMQPAALFLPFVLLLALPHGVLLLKIAMMAVAGLAARALLRQLGLLPAAALAGAAMFQLSAAFAWWSDAPMLPVAFLPLLLLGIEQAREGRRGGHVTIAVALAFSIYAGFPQTAWFNGLLAGGWALLRLLQSPSRGAAWGFSWRVGLGFFAGLLLTMPLLIPFAQYFALGTVGDRNIIDFRGIFVFPVAFAHWLFPFLFGPIAAYSPYHDMLMHQWGQVGGYVGIGLPFVTLLALAGPARERALRLVLAGWILLCVTRMAGTPLLGDVLNLAPLARYTQFSRYAFPSILGAFAVLFAFAIDDRLRGAAPRRATVLGIAAALVLAASIALATAWPMLREVAAIPAAWAARHFATLALAIGAVALAGLTLAAWQRRWPHALAIVVLAEAAILFALPLFGGMRGGRVHQDAIAWLQAHTGDQRIVTIGTLIPHYPGFFGIASVNHIALPVANEWVDHIRTHLEPAVNPNLFSGDFPPPVPERMAALRDHLDGYAALGVRWVVARADWDAWGGLVTSGQGILTLGPGRAIEAVFPAPAGATPRIARIGVRIGTFLGRSTGTLRLDLCAAAGCVTGSAPLAGAADNALLPLALSGPPPLPEPGEALRIRISQPEGVAVAVSFGPAPGATTIGPNGQALVDTAPVVAIEFHDPSVPPVVFANGHLVIREIPGAAPYWQVTEGGPCALHPAGWRVVEVHCAAPALLLRRAFDYPGWSVRLDGQPATLARVAPLFHAVALPEGRHRVAFHYAPPHLPIALGLAALGLALLVSPWLMRGAVRAR